jgi:hypothetical protein
MSNFLKALLSVAICLILNQLTVNAQGLLTTSPTNRQVRFDNSGNLLLRGFVFDNIPNYDLRNASWNMFSPYSCPTSLWFGSPLFVDPVSTPYRAWEVEGNLYLQGYLYTNRSSLPTTGVAFKNNTGVKVAVLTPQANLYMKGSVNRDASCTTPVYNPSKWNDDPDITGDNNCYNYGNDKITMTYAQPGQASRQSRSNVDSAGLVQNAKDDGLLYYGTSNPGSCTNGHLVACYINPGRDYHWWRKDNNGKWSQKMAWEPATNVDLDSHEITDVEHCNRGNYNWFVGYFCTCGDNAKIR